MACAVVSRVRMSKIALALLLGFATTGASASISVLFAGNSLIQRNDLPSVFKRFAAASPLHSDVDISSVTPGGAFLYDHWKHGEAIALLREKHPDFLILQGQSTEPLFAGRSFARCAALFKAEADRVRATTVLFSTWARPPGDPYYRDPSSGGSPAEMQARLNSAYSAAAKQTGAKLAPIGLAFERAHQEAPNIELLDGTQHPSVAGTYLAAAVLFRVLFSAPASSSTYDGGLPPQTAKALRRLGDEIPMTTR
jgi:hypothetical protein